MVVRAKSYTFSITVHVPERNFADNCYSTSHKSLLLQNQDTFLSKMSTGCTDKIENGMVA